MRWVRVLQAEQPVFGVVQGNTIGLTALAWQDILAGAAPEIVAEIPLEGAPLLAPLERPGKIVAIGQNYWDHVREQNKPAPDHPVIFTKFTTSLNYPGGVVRWSPTLTGQVDFEAELAVVVGKAARHVAEADALDYVFGYTAANDITARDLQYGDKQWVRGKSLDTFCPLGPVVTTTDEIPDPQQVAIRTTLNGTVMQDSHTGEMIFSVAHLLSFASQAFTLEPGDILLTGTPDGVGHFRNPPVYLKDGDRIVVELSGIGRLENVCETV
ncbi:MAG: fumarylacetoacetate hydrolase family protein [Anaerolineae bacterium]|nr:fumarylacetoacetate hydrolase family protein [Anaerolineae bacterium]